MQLLRQNDPRWKNVTIGKTNYTLARYGCLITDISMLSDYFGEFTRPDDLARKDWYDKEARILWAKIDFKKFKFVRRHYGEDQTLINWALREPSAAVAIEVNHSHWLCGMRNLWVDYLVADPLTGTKCWLKHRYGKKAITGFAIFQTK